LDDHSAIAPIEVFACLDSTQTEALSRLRAGDRGPRWIRAMRQTAGQGRLGRVWEGLDGNLFASWYQVQAIDLRLMPQLAFVAALATHDALRPWVRSAVALRIKWPNDVLYDGAKLCGILVQSEPVADGETGLVVGIGINVQAAPQAEAYETVALKDICEVSLSADEVMMALNRCFSARLHQWQGGGFGAMAEEWLALAYGRDRLCVVDEGRIMGEMAGLGQDGALVIRLDTGQVQAVTSGTVRYREALCS